MKVQLTIVNDATTVVVSDMDYRSTGQCIGCSTPATDTISMVVLTHTDYTHYCERHFAQALVELITPEPSCC